MYQRSQAVYSFCQCRFGSNVVLGDAKNRPTLVFEFGCDSPVTRDGARDLVQPEFTVQSFMLATLRAAVPEAPVDEDDDLLSWEYDVGLAGEF